LVLLLDEFTVINYFQDFVYLYISSNGRNGE